MEVIRKKNKNRKEAFSRSNQLLVPRPVGKVMSRLQNKTLLLFPIFPKVLIPSFSKCPFLAQETYPWSLKPQNLHDNCLHFNDSGIQFLLHPVNCLEERETAMKVK